MLWLTKDLPLPFGKLARTPVQKQGTPEPQVPDVPAPAPTPQRIPSTPELIHLSTPPPKPPEPPRAELVQPPTPPAPTPAAAPTPKPIPPPSGPVAVLTLDEQGMIVSAAEACDEIFGRESASMAGQSVRVFLKGALDNEIGQFLERHRLGKNPAGATTLRVTALRNDGTEFPAHVTAVTWNWDTTVIVKGVPSRLTWTAAFRNLAGK